MWKPARFLDPAAKSYHALCLVRDGTCTLCSASATARLEQHQLRPAFGP